MTPDRATVLLKGQSTIAQKVYELVPIQEAWTVAQIHHELVRQHGSSQSSRITHGCLRALDEAGLVKSEGGRIYQRRRITTKPVSKENSMSSTTIAAPVAETPAAAAPAVRTSTDSLTALSTALSTARAAITTTLTNLINTVDDVILEVEQEREDTAKLVEDARELKVLLQRFGK